MGSDARVGTAIPRTCRAAAVSLGHGLGHVASRVQAVSRIAHSFRLARHLRDAARVVGDGPVVVHGQHVACRGTERKGGGGTARGRGGRRDRGADREGQRGVGAGTQMRRGGEAGATEGASSRHGEEFRATVIIAMTHPQTRACPWWLRRFRRDQHCGRGPRPRWSPACRRRSPAEAQRQAEGQMN